MMKPTTGSEKVFEPATRAALLSKKGGKHDHDGTKRDA